MDHHEARIRSEAFPGRCDSLRVTVDREHAPVRAQRCEDARCVAAATEGRVDVQAVAVVRGRIRAKAEPCERFFDKHRCVLIQFLRPRSTLIKVKVNRVQSPGRSWPARS